MSAGKIADVLSFGGTQAVPEGWSVYRMIHLSDHKGFEVEQDKQKQLYESAGVLLLTWVFIFKMLPIVSLSIICLTLSIFIPPCTTKLWGILVSCCSSIRMSVDEILCTLHLRKGWLDFYKT